MLKFAVRNLLSRPARSLLALAGLTVAIVGMVGLFSVAAGLDRLTADAFGRVTGLLAMQPGAPIPLFSKLPAGWGDEIAAVEGVAVVNPEVWQRVNVIESKMIISPPRFLFGTDIATRLQLRSGVYKDDIEAGRFLLPGDRGTSNAVISRQIAEEFHRGVGETLRVNGNELTIVGIYHTGSLLLDVAIIMDIGQVRRITRFDANSVSSFYIEQAPGTDNHELADRISALFAGRGAPPWEPSSEFGLGSDRGGNLIGDFFTWLDRRLKGAADKGETTPAGAETPRQANGAVLPPAPARTEAADVWHVDETRPIEIRSASDWASRFDQFSDDLDLLLGILTSIGVIIAVLSILNTMLMSVSERMIEFGILKANGWAKSDVLRLIGFESGLLGLAGGVCGATLGWLATQAINAAWPTRVQLYAGPGLLLFSLVFATVVGLLGGLYPAIWAMRMMPMDAIRRG